MRAETLWGEQRRAAREHWWGQVLARPETTSWEEVLDETIGLRFALRPKAAESLAREKCVEGQPAAC